MSVKRTALHVPTLGTGAVERAPRELHRLRRGGIIGFAAVVVAVVTVVLTVVARSPLRWNLAVAAGLVVAWCITGLTLLASRVLYRLGRVVIAGALVGAVAVAARADEVADGAGSGHSLGEAAHMMALVLLPAFGLHVLLGLPDGRLVTAARRRAVVVGYTAATAAGVLLWTAEPGSIVPVIFVASALTLLALPAVARAYRAAEGSDRRQLQWLACGAVAFVELALAVLALRALIGWPRPAGTAVALVSVLLPAAFAATAFPALVARADRVVITTVTATAFTAIMGFAYLALVLALARVPDRQERVLLLLSLLVASAAAFGYLSARSWLSELGRALAYGGRPPPEELLRSFESRLTRAVPLEELLRQVAESLRGGMGLATAEIWTGSDGVLQRAVSVPERPPVQLVLTAEEEQVVTRAGVSGPAWVKVWLPTLLAGRDDRQLLVVPVVSSSELLGLIVVERTARGEPFSEDEEHVLSELARKVGLALRTVQLDSALQQSLDELRRQANELQESRARIVAAADAARLRIERDLHDGAQQHLLALNVKLQLASRLASSDAKGTEELLDQLSADVQQVSHELRNLAHGIYPALLADHGLAEALGAAADQAPIATRVDARGLRRYPSDLEAAVYFCCAEALHNAAKHAGPTATANIRVWEDSGGLLFEIADDGVGFDSSRQQREGAGFVNMADRIGAVGGHVHIDSSPGRGTRVSGRIPLGLDWGDGDPVTPAARPGT